MKEVRKKSIIKKKSKREQRDERETHLRKYLPYCIEVKDDTYYMINRDYTYINMDTKCIGFGGKRTYLFDDSSSPLQERAKYQKQMLADVIENFAQLTQSMQCLNPNIDTTQIMQRGAQNVNCPFSKCGLCWNDPSHGPCQCKWKCSCNTCIDISRMDGDGFETPFGMFNK